MALGGQVEVERKALTLCLEVGPGPEFKGQCQHRLPQRIQAEILHKGRQIKVAKDLVGARLDGLGDLPRYRKVPRQFPHLGHKEVLVPGRVRYWPAEAGEDIGGIADDQPREVLCKDIHSVVIDKLWGEGEGTRSASANKTRTDTTWGEAGRGEGRRDRRSVEGRESAPFEGILFGRPTCEGRLCPP